MIWLILFIIAIIPFIAGGILTTHDRDLTSFLCFTLSVLLIIMTVLIGLTWGLNKLSYKSNVVAYQQTRAVLIDELRKYESMRGNDVTGSTTYLELQKEIIDFNFNINQANNIQNFLTDHSIIDPAYREIEPIPIQVG